jgi:hypothetical protein
MPPTTDVAPIKKRRLSLLTTASVAIPAFRARFFPKSCIAKPSNYTGFATAV